MNEKQLFQLKSALYTMKRIEDDLVLLEELEGDLVEEEAIDHRWDNFLKSLEELDDPVIYGIFKSATAIKLYNTTLMKIYFPKRLEFFNDWINNSSKTWIPLIIQQFGEVNIDCFFE